MELFTVLVVGLLTLVAYLFLKALRANRYWIERGIPQGDRAWPFFGHMLPVLLHQQTIGEVLKRIYQEHPDERVVGFYFFMMPSLLVKDLDFVENVLIKDFAHFVDRSPITPNLKTEAQYMNLFNTNGNLWRAIRSKLSPMFTTGKLRFMFPQIRGISETFMNLLETKKEKTDLNDYFGKFAMEVIASTAFGIDGRCMEENSEFRERGKEFFKPSLVNMMRFVLAPILLVKLGINPTPKGFQNYFGGAVKTALNYRKESKAVRNDFVQHMVTLQEKGSLDIAKEDASDEILDMDEVPDLKVEMTDDLMVGQAIGFLLAGFDATALSMSWLCFELAQNPEAQKKVRQEITQVLEKHGGRLDYDISREMKYLSYCLKENNRLHSPLAMLARVCTKPYQVPGTTHVLQPGDLVHIPSLAIHTDPLFFPEPEKFRPERWEPGNERHKATYLPWGIGPRMCIAMRFATMEMACAIAQTLVNFEITLHPSVEFPIRKEPYSFFDYPRKRIMFNLKKISV